MTRLNRYILPFVLLGLLCACNGKPEPDPQPQEPEPGRYVRDLEMHSEILKTDVKYSIYLPEDYETSTDSYPVVYMLHGLGDNWNSWNGNYIRANQHVNALESRGMLGKMIYVFPAGFSTYYCNYYNGKYNYMDMFVDEFVPFIDAQYRTVPDRRHRATVGYSMGGFGAFALAARHPEVFSCSVPLSMSFRTDRQYLAESQSAWDQQWGKIFGGIGESGEGRLTDHYKQHCPFYLFNDENRERMSEVNWMLVCGDDEEQILVAVDTLHTQMLDNGFAHEYRVVDGGHSATVWNNALMEALPFLEHHMCGAAAWPACSAPSFTRQEVSFEEDGTALAPGYNAENGCVAIYVFHQGLEDSLVKDLVSVAFTKSSKKNFVYLPCDLAKMGVADWTASCAAKFNVANSIAVGVADAGRAVLESGVKFDICAFVDSDLGECPEADPEVKYYFCTTDESPAYRSNGAFYRFCKRNGVKFEYRVVDCTGKDDLLNCMDILKSFITY